tara:strand:+ start:3170 stop:3733 length:564 start_codon:yes stop_codon:yes gene_type:complete
MSSGKKKTTTQDATTSVGPSGMIRGPLQTAISGAHTQYLQGPQTYAGQQSQNLLGQTLRGDFLTPESNPFAQAYMQQMGDQMYRDVGSRFGQAGRNVGGSGAAQTYEDAMAKIAVPFASQLYGTERGNQMTAMINASRFDPLNQYIQQLSPLSGMAGSETQQTGTTVQRERKDPLDVALGIATMGMA